MRILGCMSFTDPYLIFNCPYYYSAAVLAKTMKSKPTIPEVYDNTQCVCYDVING